MTLATLPNTDRVVKTDVAVETDKPIPCTGGYRRGDKTVRCEAVAEWRAFAVCEESHDSTSAFCDFHVIAASRRDMVCHRCLPVRSLVTLVIVEPIR